MLGNAIQAVVEALLVNGADANAEDRDLSWFVPFPHRDVNCKSVLPYHVVSCKTSFIAWQCFNG